jgi:hypothetical protein
MTNGRVFQQIRYSASAAFRAALILAIYTVIMIPVRSLIDSILHQQIELKWKEPVLVGGILTAVWFVAEFLSTLCDLLRHDRIQAASLPSFPAGSFIAGLYGFTLIMSLSMMIGMYSEGDSWKSQLIPLAFMVIAFYGWPRTIHCDEHSIWQRNLWGRKKTLAYEEIKVICTNAEGTTAVIGHKTIIEHTQYHADFNSFRRIICKRSGKRCGTEKINRW